MALQFHVLCWGHFMGQVLHANSAVVPDIWYICPGLLCRSCSWRAAMHASGYNLTFVCFKMASDPS